MYDLIGDIHGHAGELEELLKKLGYIREGGCHSHPGGRQVIFLGDFIDRGPRIREVLQIVRPMIDSGEARAVMGNHEFNALAYATPDPESPREFLRQHDEKNSRQHEETLRQLEGELGEYIEWFRTLPLWLEEKDKNGSPLRIVHACWDKDQIEAIRKHWNPGDRVTDEFLAGASRRGSGLYRAVECVLKGPELQLPESCGAIADKDGNPRRDIRVRWYRKPGKDETYSSYALPSLPGDPASDTIGPETLEKAERLYRPYPEDDPPVFIGHYWLEEKPERLAPNVVCVDYSIARKGRLCAYRWDGEQELDIDKIESVPAHT